VLIPGTRVGVYAVQELIGRGGMGEVYRAIDTRLKRQVALKVLPGSLAADSHRLERLEREAELLASLNDPHIAALYGIEESNGIRALVMEFVDGSTLADHIARGPISLKEALPLARQIAQGVSAAHDAGVIHRDLKPPNIKVRPDARLRYRESQRARAGIRWTGGQRDDRG
jgi:serine/threonine protein kinase